MHEKKEKIVATLDFKGKKCFEIRLTLRVNLNQIAIGEMIKVITDNPKSHKTLSNWVISNNQQLFLSEVANSDYIFYIKRLI